MSARPPREFVSGIREFCAAHELIRPGDRIVIGVSGGPDSMALLRALHELSGVLEVALTVAHLDHGLRRSSHRDAAFVRRTAGSLDIPFRTARVDVGHIASRRKFSIEEAGRLARYAFFLRVARSTRARLVAVAHQQDDQAETVLFRLLRGSSGTGLSGMAPARALSVGRPLVTLIRPLLDRSRAEVEAYLHWRGVTSLTDPSNTDPEFTRNRIRRELIPLLERRFNPRVKAALARAAVALAEDNAALESLASAVAVPHRIAVLRRVSLAIRRRVLRNAAISAGAATARLTQGHLDSLIRLIAAGAGETDLPGINTKVIGERLSFRRRR